MNINDHRDEIAQAICADLGCINYDKDVAGGCTSCDEVADLLLASPALARLLAAARDEARGEWRGDDCSHYWLLRPESDTHVCLTCGDES